MTATLNCLEITGLIGWFAGFLVQAGPGSGAGGRGSRQGAPPSLPNPRTGHHARHVTSHGLPHCIKIYVCFIAMCLIPLPDVGVDYLKAEAKANKLKFCDM